jgi:hypothetical protein
MPGSLSGPMTRRAMTIISMNSPKPIPNISMTRRV